MRCSISENEPCGQKCRHHNIEDSSKQKQALNYEAHIQFENFLKKYEKNYKNETERTRRFKIFRANLQKIRSLNELEQGTAVYGINQFADLTKSEFQKYFLGLKQKAVEENDISNTVKDEKKITIPTISLPPEFDWRNYNVVTPIKNQGMCGSCWAFSVTGNVEGQWSIKHNKLLSFSEQELIDCDKIDSGCKGGYMTDGYKAIEELGGLELESDYPYTAEDEKCSFTKNKVKAKISGSVNITSNETEMANWLVKHGPISIAINANAMQFYFGGVSHPLKFLCNPKDLNHGVLLVGYGVHKTKFTKKILPYWIVKNSWGKFWGEQGYYRVYRGAGVCGLNNMATSAFVL
ncbi:hypothetical protein PGB90_005166 [Kerria lacca]